MVIIQDENQSGKDGPNDRDNHQRFPTVLVAPRTKKEYEHYRRDCFDEGSVYVEGADVTLHLINQEASIFHRVVTIGTVPGANVEIHLAHFIQIQVWNDNPLEK